MKLERTDKNWAEINLEKVKIANEIERRNMIAELKGKQKDKY